MAMAMPDLEAKFLGAMIGGALGDAIGELAFSLTDVPALDAGIAEADVLVYTDDTAMALGLAESLIVCGAVDPQALGRAFHENFRREPWRGYGPGPPSLFASVEREGPRRCNSASAPPPPRCPIPRCPPACRAPARRGRTGWWWAGRAPRAPARRRPCGREKPEAPQDHSA